MASEERKSSDRHEVLESQYNLCASCGFHYPVLTAADYVILTSATFCLIVAYRQYELFGMAYSNPYKHYFRMVAFIISAGIACLMWLTFFKVGGRLFNPNRIG